MRDVDVGNGQSQAFILNPRVMKSHIQWQYYDLSAAQLDVGGV
jgi:hypothetical protein